MAGFRDPVEALLVMTRTFERLQPDEAQKLDLIYAYRFTDIGFSCTVVLKPGDLRFITGEASEAETTIETTSDVFDKVMRGEMNVVFAHLSNQARTIGSLGNVLKLRSAAALFSKAYRLALSELFAERLCDDAQTTPVGEI